MDMTLGEATAILTGPDDGWLCACSGPGPGAPPGAPCSCTRIVLHAHALRRGAHIAARLVLDYVARREESPTWEEFEVDTRADPARTR